MYSTEASMSEELQAYYNARKAIERKRTVIRTCEDIVMLMADLNDSKIEVFAIIFLDNQNRVITTDRKTGTVDGCSVYPREVFKKAFDCDAKSIVMVHNHPGGDSKFSESDKKITQKIYQAGKSLDIELVDHVLLYGTGHSAMRSNPVLWENL